MYDELNKWVESKEYVELHKKLEEFQKSLADAIGPLQKALKEINNTVKPMRDAFNNIVDRINKSVLSDDDKKRIKISAQRLVDNDIVITPEEGPFYFYGFKPSKKNIKSLYDSYSSGKKFNDLVATLADNKKMNNQYLKEAIKCYKNGCHLACSSLLFSIIDSHFIAKNRLNTKRQRRTLNKTLAAECLNDIENGRNFEYFFLIQSNVLLMLGKYYSHANDFKEEPTNINRNFVDHGMERRKVTRQDCVKLLVLCSYLEMV